MKINKHRFYILVILPLLLLCVAAVVLRWQTALFGISWGLERYLPEATKNTKLMQTCCSAINFGIYNPYTVTNPLDVLAFDHYFIDWNNYDKTKLLEDISSSKIRQRWPLITVEPWPISNITPSNNNLLSDISQGKYDHAINTLCSDLSLENVPLFIRFSHEMEHNFDRYPWSQKDGQKFVTAYRHFVTRCKTITNQFYYVWSPAGNENLDQYWPGFDYVDYIGLSIYSFPQWDKDHYQRIQGFDEVFGTKYNRVKDYNRPVIIAELGVAGTDEHKTSWIHNAFGHLSKYPLLKSIVFFNAQESSYQAWGNNYPLPDWRLDPLLIKQLITDYLNST